MLEQGKISRTCIGLVLFTMFVLVSSLEAATDAENVWWDRPWYSGDCSTVFRHSRSDHKFADVVTIGFFGFDGTERAVIRSRHGIWCLDMSYDGFIAIGGTISMTIRNKAGFYESRDKDGYYASLYNPFGVLQWETKFEGFVEHIAVTKGACISEMGRAMSWREQAAPGCIRS